MQQVSLESRIIYVHEITYLGIWGTRRDLLTGLKMGRVLHSFIFMACMFINGCHRIKKI